MYYYIISVLLLFSSLVLMHWHNSHKANYRDSAQEHNTKYYTFSKQPKTKYNVKVKAVPLQSWSGPESSRKLRFPDFMTTAQDGGKIVEPYAPAAFTLRKYT